MAASSTKCTDWFKRFIYDQPVEIVAEDLRLFIKNELKLNVQDWDEKYKSVLPSLLVIYIKTWPGWQQLDEYFKGKITYEAYYDKFKEYLKLKLGATVLNHLEEVHKSALLEMKNSSKNLAPYMLQIKCPAEMLSTIIFTSEGNDVILKQHLGKHWSGLDTIQLLNWPNIRVIFISDDLFFLRHNCIEYDRYLNFVPAEYKVDETIVESAEMISSRKSRSCFTYRLLKAYVDEYMDTLKNNTKLMDDRIEEIQNILDQFLGDVKYMDIKPNANIATNTKVTFRLSPVSYVRNKKLVHPNPSENRIGYCEVLTPKVELLLRHFRAVVKPQPTDPTKPFGLSETVIKNPNYVLIPKIYYKCVFCNRDFIDITSKRDILFHLLFEHRMEQPLRCVRCKQHFDVTDLAKRKWYHKCDLGANKIVIKEDTSIKDESTEMVA